MQRCKGCAYSTITVDPEIENQVRGVLVNNIEVILFEELDDIAYDGLMEHQRNGGDLKILQVLNFSSYAALKGIKVTKDIIGCEGRLPPELSVPNIVEYILTLKSFSGNKERIFARAMKGQIVSSLNFLINPGMDQEATDVSHHIIEVFKKATGPNNNLIKKCILIPGDCDDSVDPGDESVAYEPEEQSMTSGMNESQQELVAPLSKLEEKFQAFERMDKKLCQLVDQ